MRENGGGLVRGVMRRGGGAMVRGGGGRRGREGGENCSNGGRGEGGRLVRLRLRGVVM